VVEGNGERIEEGSSGEEEGKKTEERRLQAQKEKNREGRDDQGEEKRKGQAENVGKRIVLETTVRGQRIAFAMLSDRGAKTRESSSVKKTRGVKVRGVEGGLI